MRMAWPTVIRSFAITLTFAVCLANAEFVGSLKQIPLSNLERSVVFAVRQEIQSGHFEQRKDLCIAAGKWISVDEKRVLSELGRQHLPFHANRWCNDGPRGLVIAILAPAIRSAPPLYEFVVDVSDSQPIRQEGAHFATLLRSGTYQIRCEDNSEPELIKYFQTCCPNMSDSKPKRRRTIGDYFASLHGRVARRRKESRT